MAVGSFEVAPLHALSETGWPAGWSLPGTVWTPMARRFQRLMVIIALVRSSSSFSPTIIIPRVTRPECDFCYTRPWQSRSPRIVTFVTVACPGRGYVVRAHRCVFRAVWDGRSREYEFVTYYRDGETTYGITKLTERPQIAVCGAGYRPHTQYALVESYLPHQQRSEP
jgi:hypothetical protein